MAAAIGDLRMRFPELQGFQIMMQKVIEVDTALRPLAKSGSAGSGFGSNATSSADANPDLVLRTTRTVVQALKPLDNMATGKNIKNALLKYRTDLAPVYDIVQRDYEEYQKWHKAAQIELRKSTSAAGNITAERIAKALATCQEAREWLEQQPPTAYMTSAVNRQYDSKSFYSETTERLTAVKNAIGTIPNKLQLDPQYADVVKLLKGRSSSSSTAWRKIEDAIKWFEQLESELQAWYDRIKDAEDDARGSGTADLATILGQKPSFSNMLAVIGSSSPDPRVTPLMPRIKNASTIAEAIESMLRLVKLATLYDALKPALIADAQAAAVHAQDLISKATGPAPEMATRKRTLDAVRTAVNDMITQLATTAIDDGVRPASMDKLLAAVNSALAALGQEYLATSSGTGPSTYSVLGMGAAGDGSGNSGDGTKGAGKNGSMLYRTIDPQRVARYLKLLQNHVESVESFPLSTRVSNSLARFEANLAALDDSWRQNEQDAASGDISMRESRRKALRKAKVDQLIEFEKRARNAVKAYVRMQVRFIGQKHRVAAQYMAYWTSMTRTLEAEPKIKEQIDAYNKVRKDLVDIVTKRIHEYVRQPVLKAYATVSSGAGTILDERSATIIDVKYRANQEFLHKETQHLQVLYMRGSASAMDEVTDPRIITLYCLKAVRLACAWMALRIAGNAFQRMYDKSVYGLTTDRKAPSPLWFVAMAVGLDLAMTAGVTVLVAMLGSILEGAEDMPLDAQLLKNWGVDVLVSTAIIALLLVVIAVVIYRKKYFRYKYEGDRGVRALQEMAFYTYGIVLVIPFYRLTYG